MFDRMRWSTQARLAALLVCIVCPAAVGSARAGESMATRELLLAEALFPELGELLQTSLRQSPRILASRLSRLRAEQLIYVSSSGLYPRANANWEANIQQEKRLVDGATESIYTEKSYYGGGATQPLFHWGALRANAEIGKIQAEVAENNLVDAYRGLALEVRRQFLSLILARASLRQSEDALETQRERIETVRIGVEAGVALAGAVSSAEYAIRQIELALDRQRRDFRFSIEQFGRLAGTESFAASDIPELIPNLEILPENVALSIHQEFVTNDRYQSTPVYDSAEMRLQQEKLRQRVVQVGTRPNVDLRVGITQDERSDTADVGDRYEFSATYAGLGITWNLFDGFAGRGRRLAAATAVRQLENTLEETKGNLLQSAERTWTEVDFARRSLEFVERSLRSASRSFELRREDRELGRVSHDAVVDAERAFTAAENNAFAARVTYLNALAAFLSAVNADPVVDAARSEILRES